MGLSTDGYYGHVFWDADTFMFPVLMALHPEMAKSTVMFRYRTLDAARRNAKQNGRLGAMYSLGSRPGRGGDHSSLRLSKRAPGEPHQCRCRAGRMAVLSGDGRPKVA